MSVLSKLKKLFHICDHRWVEVRRHKVNSYYGHPVDSGGMPNEIRLVTELRCSRCGDIKVKRIKL